MFLNNLIINIIIYRLLSIGTRDLILLLMVYYYYYY